MRVRVLYFASAGDLALTKSETLTVPKGTVIEGLLNVIMKKHPALRKLQGSARFSLNLVVANGDELLRDGDEVGVLPPVAGG